MKAREYTITTGSYDNFEIRARVRGPATPALSTLWRRFAVEFGVRVPQNIMTVPSISAEFDAQAAANTATRKRLTAAGYNADIANAFIEWLVDQHDFEVLKPDNFHIRY